MDIPVRDGNVGRNLGYSLIELMITAAVLSVLAGIAIPLYNNYIREGHYATMRSSLSRLRTDIEDFRLENASYTGVDTAPAVTPVLAELNAGQYTYTISPNANSYDVWGVFNSAIWVRCDNRFTNCCDPDTPGTSDVTSACP